MNKMMVFMRRVIFVFIALLSVCVFVGCGETPEVIVKVDSVTVSGNVKMTVGEKQTLTFEVLPADAKDKSVTWSSSDETVCTVTDGLVEALKSGTAKITCKANNDKAGEITITVEEEKLNAENIKVKLNEIYTAYKDAAAATIKISLVNDQKTLTTDLKYELNSEKLYEKLYYTSIGDEEASLYIKDGKAYMNVNETKNQYALDESENKTIAENYGISALLEKVNAFYGEQAFYTALSYVSDSNGEYKFNLNLQSYSGSVFTAAGKDKIELTVVVSDNIITSVMVTVTKGTVISSTKVEYLGLSADITYPDDLSSYPD